VATYQTTSPTSLADELACVTKAGAVAQNNITGSTTGKIYILEADNTLNTDFGIYLNIADASSATAGTTNPHFRFFIPKGRKTSFIWGDGHTYSAGVSLWVTTDKATASTSGPTNNVVIKMVVTA
tara:strand:+ start:1540 stop:1914 length:375 start_codon:yes stop_codon:yes gene_type:complete